jgi:hypothetical protein
VTRDRALEIIAASGADPARWPDEERASIERLAEQDAGVAAALRRAAALDSAIAQWLDSGPAVEAGAADRTAAAVLAAGLQASVDREPDSFIPAAGAARAPVARSRQLRRFGVGAALLASLAAGLVSLDLGMLPAPRGGSGADAVAPAPVELAAAEPAGSAPWAASPETPAGQADMPPGAGASAAMPGSFRVNAALTDVDPLPSAEGEQIWSVFFTPTPEEEDVLI